MRIRVMNPVVTAAIEELRRMVLAALGGRDAGVWLFRSCARGEARQCSDIDVAIPPPAKPKLAARVGVD
jgi:predicted nucleotidyltransferase